MPLFDRLHRPDALVDPRHASGHSVFGVPIGGHKQIVHEIEHNTEQQNRVHQSTVVREQPYTVQPTNSEQIINQSVGQLTSQEGAINNIFGQNANHGSAYPQQSNPRPALQGHVMATDPPLPNPTSSTHVPGAIGPVMAPHLQGVSGRNSPSSEQLMRAPVNAQYKSPHNVSNAFMGTPSCDFPSPTTLTTPFTTLTPGPGTPPTPPEPEPNTGCTMRRVDSNFSGFSGLQMNSPTTSVASMGSATTIRPAQRGGFAQQQFYTQQDRQSAQQQYEQQQYSQQQELQQQNQLREERLNSLMSLSQYNPVIENHQEQEGQRDSEVKYEMIHRPIQCEIKDPTRNSPRAEYCGYTAEQIQQQQRDFVIQQQQKFAQTQSMSRRNSTAHPQGLPPSPQPLGPSSQSLMKMGSGLGLGSSLSCAPPTPFGPGIGMPVPPPPFGVPPIGMPGGVPPLPGMLGMPGMPSMGVPPMPGMLPF